MEFSLNQANELHGTKRRLTTLNTTIKYKEFDEYTYFGNIDFERNWVNSNDYVYMKWLTIQKDENYDFDILTATMDRASLCFGTAFR